MANKKFSEFELKTTTSDVSHIVGYNGAENVQITPANFVTTGGTGVFLPLAGGTMTGTNGVVFPDNFYLNLGTSSDFEIYHDGNNSYLKDQGTGELILASNGTGIKLEKTTGEKMIHALTDGAVELYYDSVKKLETTSLGATVTGDLLVTGTITGTGGSFLPLAGGLMVGNTTHNDNVKSIYGSPGNDLQIYHDSSNSYIQDAGTGNLYIDSSNLYIRVNENENAVIVNANSSVDLYHNGTKKFETTSTGISVTGDATFDDNGELQLGDGNDAQIYHSGGHLFIDNSFGNSYIRNTSGGSIILRNSTDGDIQLDNEFAGNILFNTSNIEKMRLDASGNLGIGTVPTRKMDVRDSSNTQSTLLAYNQGASFTGTVYEAITDRTASSDFNLMNLKASTESKFLVRGDGNVGVGTSTPDAKLSIARLSNAINTEISFKDAGGTRAGVIGMEGATTNDMLLSTLGGMRFYTNSNVAVGSLPSNERMRLDSSGDLGLGTSALTNSAGFATLSINGSTGGQIAFQKGGAAKQFIFNNDIDLSIYNQEAGSLKFFTSALQRMVIDSAGNVCIGNTSVTGFNETLNVTGSGIVTENINGGNRGMFGFFGGTPLLIGTGDSVDVVIRTDNTERMRVTSGGEVLIGKTVVDVSTIGTLIKANGQLLVATDGDNSLDLNRRTNGGNIAVFRQDTTVVGSVTVTSSATAYNTTSDYRLKEDLQDFNGLELVSKIPVYDYKWKSSNDRGYGVMAHQLQEVLPQAVTGDKDAEEMQSVDYSKIVPLLVKSIQELKAEIELLKNK